MEISNNSWNKSVERKINIISQNTEKWGKDG